MNVIENVLIYFVLPILSAILGAYLGVKLSEYVEKRRRDD